MEFFFVLLWAGLLGRGISPRHLHTHRTTQTDQTHKHIDASFDWISVFELAKTIQAFDPSATVISNLCAYQAIISMSYENAFIFRFNFMSHLVWNMSTAVHVPPGWCVSREALQRISVNCHFISAAPNYRKSNNQYHPIWRGKYTLRTRYLLHFRVEMCEYQNPHSLSAGAIQGDMPLSSS
jgi:hypothetical protein